MPQKNSTKGAWIVEAADGQIYVEKSEIQALRTAVLTQGTPKFVEYGNSVSDADTIDTASDTDIVNPEPTPDDQPEPMPRDQGVDY